MHTDKLLKQIPDKVWIDFYINHHDFKYKEKDVEFRGIHIFDGVSNIKFFNKNGTSSLFELTNEQYTYWCNYARNLKFNRINNE